MRAARMQVLLFSVAGVFFALVSFLLFIAPSLVQAQSSNTASDKECVPVTTKKCGCGLVEDKEKGGCKKGDNKYQCICEQTDAGKKTTGTCNAEQKCLAIQTDGKAPKLPDTSSSGSGGDDGSVTPNSTTGQPSGSTPSETQTPAQSQQSSSPDSGGGSGGSGSPGSTPQPNSNSQPSAQDQLQKIADQAGIQPGQSLLQQSINAFMNPGASQSGSGLTPDSTNIGETQIPNTVQNSAQTYMNMNGSNENFFGNNGNTFNTPQSSSVSDNTNESSFVSKVGSAIGSAWGGISSFASSAWSSLSNYASSFNDSTNTANGDIPQESSTPTLTPTEEELRAQAGSDTGSSPDQPVPTEEELRNEAQQGETPDSFRAKEEDLALKVAALEQANTNTEIAQAEADLKAQYAERAQADLDAAAKDAGATLKGNQYQVPSSATPEQRAALNEAIDGVDTTQKEAKAAYDALRDTANAGQQAYNEYRGALTEVVNAPASEMVYQAIEDQKLAALAEQRTAESIGDSKAADAADTQVRQLSAMQSYFVDGKNPDLVADALATKASDRTGDQIATLDSYNKWTAAKAELDATNEQIDANDKRIAELQAGEQTPGTARQIATLEQLNQSLTNNAQIAQTKMDLADQNISQYKPGETPSDDAKRLSDNLSGNGGIIHDISQKISDTLHDFAQSAWDRSVYGSGIGSWLVSSVVAGVYDSAANLASNIPGLEGLQTNAQLSNYLTQPTSWNVAQGFNDALTIATIPNGLSNKAFEVLADGIQFARGAETFGAQFAGEFVPNGVAPAETAPNFGKFANDIEFTKLPDGTYGIGDTNPASGKSLALSAPDSFNPVSVGEISPLTTVESPSIAPAAPETRFAPTAEQMADLTRPIVPAEIAPSAAEIAALKSYNNALETYTAAEAKASVGLYAPDSPIVTAARNQLLDASTEIRDAGLLTRLAPLEEAGVGVDSVYRAGTGEVLAERIAPVTGETPYRIVGDQTPVTQSQVPNIPREPTGSTPFESQPSARTSQPIFQSAPQQFAEAAPRGTQTIFAERPFTNPLQDLLDPSRLPIAPETGSTGLSATQRSAIDFYNATQGELTNLRVAGVSPTTPLFSSFSRQLTDATAGLNAAGLAVNAATGAITNGDTVVAVPQPVQIPGQSPYIIIEATAANPDTPSQSPSPDLQVAANGTSNTPTGAQGFIPEFVRTLGLALGLLSAQPATVPTPALAVSPSPALSAPSLAPNAPTFSDWLSKLSNLSPVTSAFGAELPQQTPTNFPTPYISNHNLFPSAVSSVPYTGQEQSSLVQLFNLEKANQTLAVATLPPRPVTYPQSLPETTNPLLKVPVGKLTDQQIISTINSSAKAIQDYWSKVFADNGGSYRRANIVIVDSKAGKVLQGDINFKDIGGNSFMPTTGDVRIDIAAARDTQYTLATNATGITIAQNVGHEIGHYVARITGVDETLIVKDMTGKFQTPVSAKTGYDADTSSELLADYLSGVALKGSGLLSQGDPQILYDNVAVSGDDIVRVSNGNSPTYKPYTHGTAADRAATFYQGLLGGDPTKAFEIVGIAPDWKLVGAGLPWNKVVMAIKPHNNPLLTLAKADFTAQPVSKPSVAAVQPAAPNPAAPPTTRPVAAIQDDIKAINQQIANTQSQISNTQSQQSSINQQVATAQHKANLISQATNDTNTAKIGLDVMASLWSQPDGLQKLKLSNGTAAAGRLANQATQLGNQSLGRGIQGYVNLLNSMTLPENQTLGNRNAAVAQGNDLLNQMRNFIQAQNQTLVSKSDIAKLQTSSSALSTRLADLNTTLASEQKTKGELTQELKTADASAQVPSNPTPSVVVQKPTSPIVTSPNPALAGTPAQTAPNTNTAPSLVLPANPGNINSVADRAAVAQQAYKLISSQGIKPSDLAYGSANYAQAWKATIGTTRQVLASRGMLNPQLDAPAILGLTRQETSIPGKMTEFQSPTGVRGLMQVTGGTAVQTLGNSMFNTWQGAWDAKSFAREDNIGSVITGMINFDQLLYQYNGDISAAAQTYNSGSPNGCAGAGCLGGIPTYGPAVARDAAAMRAALANSNNNPTAIAQQLQGGLATNRSTGANAVNALASILTGTPSGLPSCSFRGCAATPTIPAGNPGYVSGINRVAQAPAGSLSYSDPRTGAVGVPTDPSMTKAQFAQAVRQDAAIERLVQTGKFTTEQAKTVSFKSFTAVQSGVAPQPLSQQQLQKVIDDYLWSHYSTGDEWKDTQIARQQGMTPQQYVIGGISPSLKLNLFTAFKAMEAQGLRPTISSGFRDDPRQAIAEGSIVARVGYSQHGGSQVTGGYGAGNAVDVNGTNVQQWIDNNGNNYGIYRPLGDRDRPHVQALKNGSYDAITRQQLANVSKLTTPAPTYNLIDQDGNIVAHNVQLPYQNPTTGGSGGDAGSGGGGTGGGGDNGGGGVPGGGDTGGGGSGSGGSGGSGSAAGGKGAVIGAATAGAGAFTVVLLADQDGKPLGEDGKPLQDGGKPMADASPNSTDPNAPKPKQDPNDPNKLTFDDDRPVQPTQRPGTGGGGPGSGGPGSLQPTTIGQPAGQQQSPANGANNPPTQARPPQSTQQSPAVPQPLPQPQIQTQLFNPTISCSPTSIPRPATTTAITITWNCSGGVSLGLGFVTNGAISGATTTQIGHNASSTILFGLLCTQAVTQTPAQCAVNVASSTPASLSLIANPQSVPQGQRTTLSWSSAGISACQLLSGGSVLGQVATSGSVTSPQISTTTLFTVQCLSVSGDTLNATTSVKVQ